MVYMFIFTLVATIGGTLLGALVANISQKHKGWLTFIQNFSVGAIIAFLFIDLFKESLEYTLEDMSTLGGVATILGIVLVVVLLFFALHELIHHLTHHHKIDHDDSDVCDDHIHIRDIFMEEENNNRSLLTTSFIFMAAIFIHNIPEGLALGISFVDDESWIPGLIFSCIMLLHNFVIGISMFNSFKGTGRKMGFSVGMCVLASLPAYIFAIVGYFIGSIEVSNVFLGCVYAFAFGSLLYVVLIELLPQIFKEYKSAFSIIYVVLGFVIFGFLLFL